MLFIIFCICWLRFRGFSEAANVEPEVILVGNPAKLKSSLQVELPTGYSWIPAQHLPRDFPQITGDQERDEKAFRGDPRVIYRFSERLDVQKVIDDSRKDGKTQIYLLSAQPSVDEMVPLKIVDDAKLLIDNLYPAIVDLSSAINPLASFEAHAHSSNVPAWNGCSTGAVNNAGQCYSILDLAFFCYDYASNYCHFGQLALHSARNMDGHGNGSDVNNSNGVAFARAMRYLGTPMGYPTINNPLIIDVYKSSNDLGFRNSCGLPLYFPHNVLACAQCPNCGSTNKPDPRVQGGKLIVIADDTTNNEWFIIRHEFAHTFSYSHCDMDLNIDNVGRSINSNGLGTSVPEISPGVCPQNHGPCDGRGFCTKGPTSPSFPNNVVY